MLTLLDIQRMSSEDGPGLRTTAFLKGCPLACAWCHNPESLSPDGEVLWHRNRCINCASCVAECPQQGITLGEERLSVQREQCLGCFTCSRACPTGALEVKGQAVEVDDLVHELLKDQAYFGAEGGVTLSGGEALMQAESVDVLRALKTTDVKVAVDTCGQVAPSRLQAALAFVDLVLFDLKLADSKLHEYWTGAGNELILKNLGTVARWAADGEGRLWIRTPIIPGATDSDENIRGLAAVLNGLGDSAAGDSAATAITAPAIERWELCAFNNLCASKYESIEQRWRFADAPLMTGERMIELVELAQSLTGITDIRATGATA